MIENKRNLNISTYFAIAAMFFCLLYGSKVHAQMTFDFTPDETGYMSSSGGSAPFLLQNVVYQPPFLPFSQIINVPEIVEIDGTSYYHLIVGDPATDFVQEVYIQRGFSIMSNDQPGSASSGVMRNDSDPLGSNGGSGTGNPNRVMLKQVLSQPDFTLTFTKDTLANKPVITQSLHTSEIIVFSEINMGNSTYADTTLGTMINTTSLIGNTRAPGRLGDFDMEEDKQISTLTAGQYTYAAGGGDGGSDGSYIYGDGGFDPTSVNWESYVLDRPDNVWSIPTNDPFP